jgi:hypothetical protein
MPGAGDISAVANVEGWHTPAFARGVRDNVIGEVGLQVVRIGGLVVLARALTPSDFGLFRVLITFSAIIMMVNDLAAPDTLVQRPELTSAHESSAWWATISVSMLTCGVLYLLAPLIAQAMAMPSPTHCGCYAFRSCSKDRFRCRLRDSRADCNIGRSRLPRWPESWHFWASRSRCWLLVIRA